MGMVPTAVRSYRFPAELRRKTRCTPGPLSREATGPVGRQQSRWQRATNEGSNDLLHQYFPKGTDMSRWSAEQIAAVAHAVDTRPCTGVRWNTGCDVRPTYATGRVVCPGEPI